MGIRLALTKVRNLIKGILDIHRMLFESINIKEDDYMEICLLIDDAEKNILKAVEILKKDLNKK